MKIGHSGISLRRCWNRSACSGPKTKSLRCSEADPPGGRLMADDSDSVSPHDNDAFRKSVRRQATVIRAIAALAFLVLGVVLLFPAPEVPRKRGRPPCVDNLHRIGLALHGYAGAHDAFPPAYTVDEAGNPLHSWRTLILPFLG